MSIRADRRLCFTADRDAMVEETDPRAAFLAYPAGKLISPGDEVRFNLKMKDGRVLLGNTSPPADKAVQGAAVKVVEASEDKAAWDLKVSPQEYLDRYGDDAKNSALARAVLEAEG